MLGFDLDWRTYYPSVFGLDEFYANTPLISPFWSLEDEAMMTLVADEFPEAVTKVFYQVHVRSNDMSDATREVLDRAKEDVNESGKEILTSLLNSRTYWSCVLMMGTLIDDGVSGFEPTWVLVVTWVNVAPDVGCRYLSLWEDLYGDDYDYSDYFYGYSLNDCENKAKLVLVSYATVPVRPMRLTVMCVGR